MSARLEAAVAELVEALRDEVHTEPAGPDQLLSVNEAASSLGIGRSAVYGLLSSGALRSLRIGDRRLVPTGAIRSYIEQAGS